MAATWMTQRERGHPALMRGFVRFALAVGRPVARLFLHPIVAYFVIAGGASRAASRDYLKRALGREPTIVDGYKHVHAFAFAILDRLFLLNDRHDDAASRPRAPAADTRRTCACRW
jgi:predicted LPLAT superfamily acyltransferase